MERLRLDIDINELNIKLKERDIKCLSERYLGSRKKHRWGCLRYNHQWYTTYDHVINRKQGCPYCATISRPLNKRLKITIDDINKKLYDRNIECLSDKYIKSNTKYVFHCLICDIIWEMSYNAIVDHKHGCPKCAIKNRSGENSYRWKGGKGARYPPEWNESKRIFIRNRDNHKCQYPDCDYSDLNENSETLHVHHIDGNKFNCEYYNLISLCRKHHMKIESNNPRGWEDYFYEYTESFEL